MRTSQGDLIIPRKDVPEPDEMVKFTVVGDERVAHRIIPHVAHYTEGWRYDAATGDLISYAGCYVSYVNPKYAERAKLPFPGKAPFQRWDSAKCRCHRCVGVEK